MREPAARLRWSMLAAALVALSSSLAALGVEATYGATVTADEPQYLLSAISLGEDLDLDISDELAAERYRSFHRAALNPQTRPLDASGQRLSPHDPLLPLLLAAPVRLGGLAGARVAMALVAASAAALTVWVSVRRYGVAPRVAALVVASFFAASPLASYGAQIYPELVAGVVVLVGLAAVTGRLGWGATAVGAVAVVALPWLAVKYVPVALVLAGALVLRLDRTGRRRRALGVVGALAASGVLYLAWHRAVYGGWTVYAAGDHFADGEFGVVGFNPNYAARSRRLVGLLVDRRFGLAVWAPAWFALPVSLGCVLRRRPAHWVLAVTLLAVAWASATWIALTMHGWWWPGRQLVVGLPVAVVVVAAAADALRRMVAPIVVAGVVGALSWLWIVVEASTGRLRLVIDFEDTANPWYRLVSPLFPDLRIGSAGTALATAGWALVVAAGVAWGWRASAGRGVAAARLGVAGRSRVDGPAP